MTSRRSFAPRAVVGAAVLVLMSACLTAPRDDCPDGVAGRPGCPESAGSPGGGSTGGAGAAQAGDSGAAGVGGMSAAGGSAGTGGSGTNDKWTGTGCPPLAYSHATIDWTKGLPPSSVDAAALISLDEERLAAFFEDAAGGNWVYGSGGTITGLPRVPYVDLPVESQSPVLAIEPARGENAGRLYVAGGRTNAVDGITRMYRLDLLTLVWAELTPFPEARRLSSVFWHDGKLHVLGGTTVFLEEATDSHWVLDTSTTSAPWVQIDPMPEARMAMASAQVGSFFVLFGGARSLGVAPAFSYTTLILDLESGLWQTAPAVATPRIFASAAVDCDRVFLTGGTGVGGDPVKTVDVFIAPTRTWETLEAGSALPEGRQRHGAAWFRQRIILTGSSLADDTPPRSLLGDVSWYR